MPRKRVVSRTINGTQADVLGIDLTNEMTVTRTFIIGQVITDYKKLLKKITAVNTDITFKPIAIKQAQQIKQKRIMTEEKFIALSEPENAKES